jgi:hypothetical protein
VNLRYEYEVMSEICFEEHCIKLSFHDMLKGMRKEHDAI